MTAKGQDEKKKLTPEEKAARRAAREQRKAEIAATLPDRCFQALETATFLGVSVRYLHNLVEGDPTFPRAIRFSQRRVWKLSELAAWAESKREG